MKTRMHYGFAISMALFTTAAFAADGGEAKVELKVGFSQVDITPPAGGIITGPAGPVSTGTDDPLRARAMVVQSGDRKLVIVGVDLVKIRHDLADQTIALVTQQTDITRDAVMICPSHNHSSRMKTQRTHAKLKDERLTAIASALQS